MSALLPLPQTRRVVVVAANRIPFAKSNREYGSASLQDMLTSALDGLVNRTGLAGQRVDQVVAGAVIKPTKQFNLARECVLGSRLDSTTPAFDVQQACATGLEAAAIVAHKIALGEIDCAIAGGVDSTSDAPIAVGERLRRALLKANQARTATARLKAFAGLSPADLIPVPPSVNEARTGRSMGDHAAITALEWGITREAQDELAAASHQRLAAAYERGFFDDLMTPYNGVSRDTILRPDTTSEKLAGLKTCFGRGETATMTPGNSTALTDGASTVLLTSEDWANERGLEPLAYFSITQNAAVDFVHAGEGLLMAPAYAMSHMLDRTKLSFDDFDFIEIHEAFASQVLATLAAWEDDTFCKERLGRDSALGAIDRDKLNVAGSSLAAGHPFAATGGRIVATLAKLLSEKGSGRGAISICAAGGLGMTAILER